MEMEFNEKKIKAREKTVQLTVRTPMSFFNHIKKNRISATAFFNESYRQYMSQEIKEYELDAKK
jgi:hypothetical protein